MAQAKFFDERTDQSEVKARIIQKYFYAWAKVIIPSAKHREKKIAYIDLYAGPGRYKDGAASTPLMILERAIEDQDLRQMLVTFFNDADKNHTSALQAEIDKLVGIETLAFKPHISCGEIDEDAENYFNEARLIPSFSFVDPFGYKGLSLKIVNGVIKDWGCDCVFFFNYNRINAGISNPAVKTHMDALFGEDRAEKLRKMLPERSPDKREELILEELAQAIKAMGGKYVLPFRFKNSKGTPQHTYQVLTKRAERAERLSPELRWPGNVWLGVSVENEDFEWRIDCLRRTTAAVKFLSLEPLLGPLDSLDLTDIDWAIAGGESGPGARPMNAEWVRSIRDQCNSAKVAFHFKQWGGVNKKKAGRVLDGRTWDEFPVRKPNFERRPTL